MDGTNKTIIVVEDELLVAMMIEEMLEEVGWRSIGKAQNENEALALLKLARPDAALLDVNLGSTTSLSVAAACRALNIPVAFVTGFIARDLPPECGNAPILPKPFSLVELSQTLARLA